MSWCITAASQPVDLLGGLEAYSCYSRFLDLAADGPMPTTVTVFQLIILVADLTSRFSSNLSVRLTDDSPVKVGDGVMSNGIWA